ncbi:Catechol 2,3-dioxygenase [Sphingomonas laterariae]|uniref:Catechol 2,3-dioxygenase n=1 Tax=Edaphosphingomonas laterariae TaxID=861865 RepID=A0A239GXC8_9SPHN|nr:VOC family protein [Sphingomonas laterariae]SNS73525.1 Catechol 2,3-dioxygenase [Sphingomonas laterariae]
MSVELNHTIIWCHDNKASSAFLADLLGLPPPRPFAHFMVVDLANHVSLDFMEKDGPVSTQHYAFLVGEAEFDAAFDRIKALDLDYWADPARTRPGEINRHDGGRGVYFPDPDGHLLEIITRPYGG